MSMARRAGSVRIAEVKGDRIVGIAEAEDKFIGMMQHLGSSAIQRITSAPRLAKLMAGKARLLAAIIETASVGQLGHTPGCYGYARVAGRLPGCG